MSVKKFRIVSTLALEIFREYGMIDICVVAGFVYCIVLACLFFIHTNLFDRIMTSLGFLFYCSVSFKLSNYRQKWSRGELVHILSSVTGAIIVVTEIIDTIIHLKNRM